MKKGNEHIEAEVVKTMAIVERGESLNVSHHFRTKLMQRIEQETMQRTATPYDGWQVKYKLAALLLLFALNAGSSWLLLREQPATSVTAILQQSNNDVLPEVAYNDQTLLYEAQEP